MKTTLTLTCLNAMSIKGAYDLVGHTNEGELFATTRYGTLRFALKEAANICSDAYHRSVNIYPANGVGDPFLHEDTPIATIDIVDEDNLPKVRRHCSYYFEEDVIEQRDREEDEYLTAYFANLE